MKRYMLDTNTVSHLIKAHPQVAQRIQAVPMASLCISAITEGELLFGLAKRPDAKRLHLAVREFLLRVEVLPWDSHAAERYGVTRVEMAQYGKSLAPLDCLIATHALSIGAVMVSNDQAFKHMPGLLLEDWTQ
ncbi:type II toxin-antitoxin system VapC family toxin [Iodobacter sp. HSC-16F04]|uniref:Ribonuclease VapC n=1 Tax=Iodobacter violaceini TaxID=3044271 RepID=A0ABX0L2I7_9NEIS|nr:type II toxin-antitoxin system VapC family toxin [Iodobacter violacea]NHQ86778.1 type II toxin-antitoxin system VapC family toxin [Iodobacter violacea]